MWSRRETLAGGLAALAAGRVRAAGGLPRLRLAVQAAGTVNWEVATIRDHRLDHANGFELEVQETAGSSAAMVAFQGRAADTMVSDWLWVAREDGTGKDYVFLPYSRAVGGLMVPASSGAQTLADMKGHKIGIAGGPVDKSWLILRAYAQQAHGFDLAAETTQVFGAPPLIFKAALKGEIDGAVNFWHFMARMRAAGMRELISVAQAAKPLGLSPETPLLGYVFRRSFAHSQPDLVAGFARASRAAKDLLATDDAAWKALRPRMHAASDAEFAALKAGFRAGIPVQGRVDRQAAARMLALMARLGGDKLTGGVTTLPGDLFLDPAT